MANEKQAPKTFMENERQRLLRITATLKNDRASFDSHWQDIADLTFPRRVRFSGGDRNKSNTAYWSKILNGRGTLAARTMRSGMMSGMTSPARAWRRLTTEDPDLAKFGQAKAWLQAVNDRMQAFNRQSNFYKVAPTLHGDVGTFATGAIGCFPDDERPFRYYDYPVGSYWLGCNHRGVVDTFLREFQMTVRQVVMEFGDRTQPERTKWDQFSTFVKDSFERGDYEKPVTVSQWIGFNPNFDARQIHPRFKRYTSFYYEQGARAAPGQQTDAGLESRNVFLRQSGFDLFPIMAPRWDVTGEDTYGTTCPGMEMLGDCKELQALTRKKSKGLDKQLDPPLAGPPSLRNQRVSLLSGDITYEDGREGRLGLRPIHETRFSHSDVREDLNVLESRINEYFYVDLFQMLRNMDGVQPRNEKELAMRQEEKLLELGPVVERVQDEFLNPVTDLEFHYLDQLGLLPPMPEDVRGRRLKVDHISVMAQAQKLVGVAGTERFLAFVGNMTPVYPESRHKVAPFAAIDRYADMMGVDTDMVVDSDEAQARADAERQAAAQATQAQVLGDTATAAKQLSETDTSTDNMLTRLLAGS